MPENLNAYPKMEMLIPNSSTGWRPLRTLQFLSWDAEEYNLIGSTEHVEARINDLRRDGIAYLNVDVGAVGDSFRAAGCPNWGRALANVLDRVEGRSFRSASEPSGHCPLFTTPETLLMYQRLSGCGYTDFEHYPRSSEESDPPLSLEGDEQ